MIIIPMISTSDLEIHKWRKVSKKLVTLDFIRQDSQQAYSY